MLEAQNGIARIRGKNLAGVLDSDDRKAALDRDRIADLARAHRTQLGSYRVGKLLGPDPAEVTALGSGRVFGILFDQLHEVRAALDGVLQVILPTMTKETADQLLDMIIEGWT